MVVRGGCGCERWLWFPLTLRPNYDGIPPKGGLVASMPGAVGGLASAGVHVASDAVVAAAGRTAAYGAHVGTRLWVGAASEVARMVSNSMTRGGGEVIETTVVLLPHADGVPDGWSEVTPLTGTIAAPAPFPRLPQQTPAIPAVPTEAWSTAPSAPAAPAAPAALVTSKPTRNDVLFSPSDWIAVEDGPDDAPPKYS